MKKVIFILLTMITISANAKSIDCRIKCSTMGHTVDYCDQICGYDD